MDRKLQNLLKIGFEPPKPVEKGKFIRNLPPRKVSNFELLHTQIKYIRKLTWLLYAVIFALTAFTALSVSKESMWLLSALIPFFSVSMISESGRSENYGMAELELSARFNLKTIVMAKLLILGLVNLVLMILLSLLAGGGLSASIFYIFIPYMLSAAAGLLICRKIQGNGALYLSGTVSVIIAAMEIAFRKDIFSFFLSSGEGEMFLIFSLLTAALARECYKRIKETEELKWSLE